MSNFENRLAPSDPTLLILLFLFSGRALGLLVVLAELPALVQLLVLGMLLHLLPFGLGWHAEGPLLRLLLPKGWQLLLFKLLEVFLEHCYILQLLLTIIVELQRV